MSGLCLLVPVVLLLAGGVFCAAASKIPRLSNRLGAAATVLGGLPAAGLAARTLLTGEEMSLRIPWSVPFGSLSLAMDGLSAFFVLAIAVVSILGAVYGSAYMDSAEGKGRLGAFWFFYNVLVSAMLLVVTARNGVLFLMAWEAMSLSSFFLVMFEHEKHEVREAGWTYLIAMHLGTAFLLAEFVLLAGPAESWDFALFESPSSPARASALFLLAVVGFGTKAGFLPLHVWLPEAHPAAPSHVSAVMSGVMIKTGIYGLVRMLTFLGKHL